MEPPRDSHEQTRQGGEDVWKESLKILRDGGIWTTGNKSGQDVIRLISPNGDEVLELPIEFWDELKKLSDWLTTNTKMVYKGN